MLPLPRFPGQRHVKMRVHPPFIGHIGARQIRVHLAACSMCRMPLVTEIEYVLGQFYRVVLMIAACRTLWSTISGHPFDLRRRGGSARVERVCHACGNCRRALLAYAGRPLPHGGAPRALYADFAARYPSAPGAMARVRAEIQAWADAMCDDTDSESECD